MTDLEVYFRKNDKRLIHKWAHYFDIYDRHFARFRDKEIVILEIGVSQGGSLQMWKDYFGPKAKIYGIDVNPQCKQLEEDNIKIFIVGIMSFILFHEKISLMELGQRAEKLTSFMSLHILCNCTLIISITI